MLIQIAIRYLGTKNKTTKRIMIDAENDVSALQEKIKSVFGIPLNEQVIRFKTRNCEIRIISGFTFEFYEIGNNTVLDLYRLELQQEEQEDFNETTDHKIYEVEDEDLSEGISLLNKLRFAERTTNLTMYDIEEEDIEEDEEEKLVANLKKTFLEITSLKNKKGFQSFFSQFMTLDRSTQVSVLQNTDKIGWSAVHYAVRYDEEWVIEALIPIFPEELLSLQSTDGWTPIFLAVQNKNWNILEILLKHALRHHIETQTSKGSVMHAIFKNCDFRVIHFLISQKGIDPYLKDKNERAALDLLPPTQQSHVLTLLKLREIPPKPINLFFEVQKKSFLFGWMSRYIFINAEARSFERYKEKSAYPFNPREVIPMHTIEHFKAFGHFAANNEDNRPDLIYDKQTGHVVEKSSFEKQENFIEFVQNKELHSYKILNGTHAKLVVKTFILAKNWAEFFEKFISKLKGAEHESAINVWKNVNVDFKTYDLLDPLQFTNLIKLEMKNESVRSEPLPQHIEGLKHFHVLKLLGRGAFGKVYKVLHKRTQKVFAMKVLNKKNLLRENQIKYSLIEKEILQNNPENSFLLSLHFAFQSVDSLFMVIDYCPNEDLSVLLNKQENNLLEEQTAKFYIAESFLAINELHKRNYIYRDLKPENILLDEQGHAKLADFGLAARNIRNASDFAKSFCGSPLYIAPEILRNRTAFKITDFYTMGVVLYEMLTGEPPFYNDNKDKLYSLIKKGEFKYPNHVNISNEAKDLISRLICMPKKRLGYSNGFEDIRKHPFFASIDWFKLQNKQLEPPLKFPPIVHNFNRPIKLRDVEYNELNQKVNYIPNFDFIREEYIQ